MSLHSKMAEVIGTIGTIPKNGWNDFHKYKYVLESDVVDAVSAELSKRGVAFYAASKIIEMREWQTPKGKPTLITNVQVDLTFADGETGETFTITSAGSGDDASDKGVYKATTGAVKYGLMKTFLIATGDDPERESQAPERSSQPRREASDDAGSISGNNAPNATQKQLNFIKRLGDDLYKLIGADATDAFYAGLLERHRVDTASMSVPEAQTVIDALLKRKEAAEQAEIPAV